MKIFRIFFLCIGMMFIFQAASGQSSPQFRAALRNRAALINDLKELSNVKISSAIKGLADPDRPIASSTIEADALTEKKNQIASGTNSVNETGKQEIQSLNFAGTKWGAGLGVSFLNNSEIIRASLVGSATRILEESRRSSGIVFEYHLLKPITRALRKRSKEIWEKADSLSDKFDNLIKQGNANDTILTSLTSELELLDEEIVKKSYGVNPVESGLEVLCAKIKAFKRTKTFTNSQNSAFKEALDSLETSIKYSYEVLSFSDVVVGCGPFAAIKTGGADTFGINSMALGIMFGLKALSLPEKCFNIGIGWSINNKVKRLAKNFDPNTETDLDKMFTLKDEKGWMLVISADVW